MSQDNDVRPARTEVDFDHHSPELAERVDDLGVGPVLAEFQAKCPVAWSNHHEGFYFATGYDELKKVAVDDKTFSTDFDAKHERKGRPGRPGYSGVGVPPVSIVPFGFLEMDAPEHGYIRRALVPWMAPSAAESWRPVIQDLTNAFIDDVIEKGECDFIDDVASPIPAVLTMMMLGTPLTSWKQWAHANHLQQSSAPGTPEKAEAEAAMGAMVGEIAQIIAERRAHPPAGEPTDLLGVMLQQEIGGRLLTEEEVLLHTVLLIGGGVDTTTSVMGAAVKWLESHPEERDRLRNDPSLMKTATEEFLRVFAPVTGLARTAKCPMKVGNEQLEEGDRVILMYAAANYAPEVFEDPHTVKLDRWPNKHTTFGLGGHRCIGLHIARVTFEIVVGEWLRRVPDYAIDHDTAKMYPDVGLNQGWISLPTRFAPGPKVGREFNPDDARQTTAAQSAAAATTEAAKTESDEVVH